MFYGCEKLTGKIRILTNPTAFGEMFLKTSISDQIAANKRLTVEYTAACTNINWIMATVSAENKINFTLITP